MKTISDYTIYCTPEQTKTALELGAPIEWLDSRKYHDAMNFNNKSFEETYNDVVCVIVDDNVYLSVTAEQMIGWLRSQGFRFKIEELSDTITAYRTTFGYWYKCGQSSNPKGATFAIIDNALEYLTKKQRHGQ